MFPFCFEWHWDIGHLVFFGLFFAALTVIGVGLVYAMFNTMADVFFGPKDMHDDHGH